MNSALIDTQHEKSELTFETNNVSQKGKKQSVKEKKGKKDKAGKEMVEKKQKVFQYQVQNDTMPGRVPTDTVNSTFQHQNRTQSEQFLEDYSNTQKCCIWNIFSSGGKQPKGSIVSTITKRKGTISSESMVYTIDKESSKVDIIVKGGGSKNNMS